MSSTGRGGKRSAADYYPTPEWCVRRLLEVFDPPGSKWLEPCAGDGAIVRAAAELRPDVHWCAVELRDCARDCGTANVDWFVADYLKCTSLTQRQDVAITNPPFSLAMDFWRKLREEANTIILLQRLSWIAPSVRSSVFRQDMPSVYVLPNRPSFVGGGTTDSTEYAWFVWSPEKSTTGFLSVLEETPLRERKKARRRGKPLMEVFFGGESVDAAIQQK